MAEVSERTQAAGVAEVLLHVAGIRECVARLQREYPSGLPLAVRGAIEEALGPFRGLAAEGSPMLRHESNAPAARQRPGAGAKELSPLAHGHPSDDESTRAEMAGLVR